MAIPLYLAMTAREFRICKTVPANMAWMACHFSPYGTGLSNLPTSLPPGSMIILNDRTPICGHDPELIAAQLKELLKSCMLPAFCWIFSGRAAAKQPTLSACLSGIYPALWGYRNCMQRIFPVRYL